MCITWHWLVFQQQCEGLSTGGIKTCTRHWDTKMRIYHWENKWKKINVFFSVRLDLSHLVSSDIVYFHEWRSSLEVINSNLTLSVMHLEWWRSNLYTTVANTRIIYIRCIIDVKGAYGNIFHRVWDKRKDDYLLVCYYLRQCYMSY